MPKSSKHILKHRRSLKPSQPVAPVGWTILAALILGVVVWFVSHPSRLLPAVAIVAVLWLWIYFTGLIQTRRFDRMARERSGESICEFARHFRAADFDPVVIRAVYETTQELYGRPDLPIRPSDSFSADYGIVDEDLDDLGEDIAKLAHRSMEQTDQNPLYGQVQTIADLVHFIQYQPRLSA
jgi:hypothetical protein